MAYPIIFNGDHAEFEAEHVNTPPKERPDWPLPSFDARDWAEAFCKIATSLGYKDEKGEAIDEGWMITWFANALMRGYDQRAAEAGRVVKALEEIAEPVAALQRRAEMEGHTLDGVIANQLANDAGYLRGIARSALS